MIFRSALIFALVLPSSFSWTRNSVQKCERRYRPRPHARLAKLNPIIDVEEIQPSDASVLELNSMDQEPFEKVRLGEVNFVSCLMQWSTLSANDLLFDAVCPLDRPRRGDRSLRGSIQALDIEHPTFCLPNLSRGGLNLNHTLHGYQMTSPTNKNE